MAVRSTFAPLRFLSAAACLAVLCLAAAPPRIVRDGELFKVIGWEAPNAPPADGWASVFRIHAGSADAPPMLGTYSVDQGALAFRPRFSISSGVDVLAVFEPPGGPRSEARFAGSRTEVTPSTQVAAVYPSGNVVPANLLKLYIHFSAPMQRGEAWQHIRLLDERGKPVDLPFLEIDQELWDADNRRLTVLFDPGRIKRGVLPREQIGASLEAGRSYTLEIARSWRDANGSPLIENFTKSFRVVADDRTPIDPAAWKIRPPRAGTRDALVVDLGEPADQALLQRMLSINSGGKAVRGSVRLADEERRWQFSPEEAWMSGDYRLVIDTALEDLAGNRVGRVFDVDVFERVTKRVESKTISLPFRIGLD